MRLLLVLFVVPLWAADDADAIIRRYIQADKLNDAKAEKYTFTEDSAWFNRDKNGEFKQNRSETAQMIFVEGQTYRKLVARNGQPLGAKEKAKVDKAMRETAEQRRKHPKWPDGGGVTDGHARADFGSDEELLTLFDNRLTGEEEVDGRKAWVIESTPRKDHKPANHHERDVACFNKKWWIDKTENVVLRAVYTVIGESIYVKPGSIFTFDSQKVNQEAWQPSITVVEWRNTVDKVDRIVGRLEIRYSNFKKFDVESTITIDK